MRTAVLPVLCVLCAITAGNRDKTSPANVQVYSRSPGEWGKPNTLICHVRDFYPPEIHVQLLQDGKELEGAQQGELVFGEQWHYHLTKHVSFTPHTGQTFSCRVTHLGQKQTFTWEPHQ